MTATTKQTADIVELLTYPLSNHLQAEELTAAVAKANLNGINVEQRMRRLARSGDPFTLKNVMEALKPDAYDQAGIPFHLPTCECHGTGWVDLDAHGNTLNPNMSPGPDHTIRRCGYGEAITRFVYEAWLKEHPPKPRPTTTQHQLKTLEQATP